MARVFRNQSFEFVNLLQLYGILCVPLCMNLSENTTFEKRTLEAKNDAGWSIKIIWYRVLQTIGRDINLEINNYIQTNINLGFVKFNICSN